MEETKDKVRIVIDTNVIISSLVSSEGITQAILSFLIGNRKVELLIPKNVYHEVKRYIGLISRKAKMEYRAVKALIDTLFRNMKTIDEEKYSEKDVKFYKSLVKDESDIPLVIVAYTFRPSIILTYNKRDFHVTKLKELKIEVVEPKEIPNILNTYLKFSREIKKKGKRISLKSILEILKLSKSIKIF